MAGGRRKGPILSKKRHLLHATFPPRAPQDSKHKSKFECPLPPPPAGDPGGLPYNSAHHAHFAHTFPLRAPMHPHPALRCFCVFLVACAHFAHFIQEWSSGFCSIFVLALAAKTQATARRRGVEACQIMAPLTLCWHSARASPHSACTLSPARCQGCHAVLAE